MEESSLGRELRSEMQEVLRQLVVALPDVVRRTDDRLALPPDASSSLSSLRAPLPAEGCGAVAAIERLLALNEAAGGNTGGPRCFHFVIGGSTPAALAADILATAYESLTYTWVLSPAGVELELQALDWLKEMFGLPQAWPGVMVTGGTMANFVGLAAARQWWGAEHGVNIAEEGLAGLPPIPVLTSGFVHAATGKVLALLGIGRSNLQAFSRDAVGRLDLEALERALTRLDGRPALVVVNAGEVDAGEFDPVDEMIRLARRHNTWVHVDGAFGLFARVSPRTAQRVQGIELADSVAVDGHKWLNVPYDSGYAFVRDHALLAQAFRYSADYLPGPDDARPTLGAVGPESSRRARGFAVWATLAAYGRDGHRRIVEHCLDLAQHLVELIRRTPRLESMAEVGLNIVPFRYNPGGLDDAALDDLNRRLGAAILDDGRFLVGTTRLAGRTVFRPAFSNWRTRFLDVEAFVDVVVELGAKMIDGEAPGPRDPRPET